MYIQVYITTRWAAAKQELDPFLTEFLRYLGYVKLYVLFIGHELYHKSHTGVSIQYVLHEIL